MRRRKGKRKDGDHRSSAQQRRYRRNRYLFKFERTKRRLVEDRQEFHRANENRQWLKKENKSDDVARGKDALDKYIRKKGYDPQQVGKSGYLNRAMKEMNIATMDEVYTQIGKGGTLLSKYANLLFGYFNEEKKAEQRKEEEKRQALLSGDGKKEKQQRVQRENPGIIVKGADNLMIRVARCCNPVPGDEIVGFITKGRGISVHRKDCSNITSLPDSEKARFIEVEWEDLKIGKSYNADICIVSEDRKGIFSDISRTCEDMDVHISGRKRQERQRRDHKHHSDTVHFQYTADAEGASHTAQRAGRV